MSARVVDPRLQRPASGWFWVRWAFGALFSFLGVVMIVASLVGIPLALYFFIGLRWFLAVPLWLVTPLVGWLLLRLGRVMRGLTAHGLPRDAGPRPWQTVPEPRSRASVADAGEMGGVL
ncbi:MAG TPA: hypothetical protein VEO00_06990 [Actinomycetota bacterium]|nr:hypothetical protein [Actinomycetota bacterium]